MSIASVLAGEQRWVVEHGRAEVVLPMIPDDSIDAVCCDPPAGISFLQQTWDAPSSYGDAKRKDASPAASHGLNARHVRDRARFIEAMTAIFIEALRVLKPGGWAFVWALPRTSHWTAVALEDAGFEIRDVVDHIFGQGWSKSEAQLKPAKEHWILVRKPLVGTLEQNLELNGHGALEIDAGRVFTDWNEADRPESWKRSGHTAKPDAEKIAAPPGNGINCHPLGREPSNVVFSHSPGCERVGTKRVAAPAAGGAPSRGTRRDGHDKASIQALAGASAARDEQGLEPIADFRCVPGCPVAALDAQSGTLETHGGSIKEHHAALGYGGWNGSSREVLASRGGASRFFHCFEADVDDGFVDSFGRMVMERERCAPASTVASCSSQRSVSSASVQTGARGCPQLEQPGCRALSESNAVLAESTSIPTKAQSGSSALASAKDDNGESTDHAANAAGIRSANLTASTARGPASRDHRSDIGCSARPTRGEVAESIELSESDTAPTPSSESDRLPALPPTKRIRSRTAAKSAAVAAPSGTTTTTTVLSTCAGSAIAATCSTTSSSTALGGLVCDVGVGFRYVAKPASSEKDAGLDGDNPHVTVKSVALMRHLLRLIAKPGWVVVDMFCGSGTTLIGAVLEGMRAIGIEMMPIGPDDDDYVGTARARVAHWAANGKPKRPTSAASSAHDDPRQRTIFDVIGGAR